MSGKIVMIGSMKGGVSKTVTTFNILLKALVLSSISIDLIIRTISMEGQEHYIRQLRISKAMMSGR